MAQLFVDDSRECPTGWRLARTITEAVEILSRDQIDLVSLDHDIVYEIEAGGEDYQLKSPENFTPVARYIALMPEDDRPVVIYHTNNPVGEADMRKILEPVAA